MMIPTLADNFGEIVAVSIGVIIMVGSALGNALKKKDKSNQIKQGGSSHPRTDLDQLAAKRRAELIAEAQRRRQHRQQQGRPAPPMHRGQSPSQPPTQPQSRPLTMAERMRQARQQAMEQAAAHVQMRRRQIEAQRQQLQQRHSHTAAPPRQPAQPQRPQVSQLQHHAARPSVQAHQPRPVPQQPVPAIAPPSRRIEQPHPPHYDIEHDQVHRLVRDVRRVMTAPHRARLDHHSLRQAIIWKEILDKPLALRDLEP